MTSGKYPHNITNWRLYSDIIGGDRHRIFCCTLSSEAKFINATFWTMVLLTSAHTFNITKPIASLVVLWSESLTTNHVVPGSKLALILRTIPTQIPSEWLLRPQCALWPPTRRRAVMWILANVILFRTRPNQGLTLRDFIEFMQANKYKLYQTVKRRLLVANYLCVLDKS